MKINTIHNKVVYLNLLRKNKSLLKLRDLNCYQLKKVLEENGFLDESKLFFDEGVDGMGFIFIFTEKEGCDILENDFRFDFIRIEKLKQYYFSVFILRKMNSKCFNIDELPFEKIN